MNKQRAFALVEEELTCATLKFGYFSSAHEGYAVIKEELDELWETIKDKKTNTSKQAREAEQLAAMAIRFLIDIC